MSCMRGSDLHMICKTTFATRLQLYQITSLRALLFEELYMFYNGLCSRRLTMGLADRQLVAVLIFSFEL